MKKVNKKASIKPWTISIFCKQMIPKNQQSSLKGGFIVTEDDVDN